MKEFKLVLLNKGLSWSREKDLIKAETLINQYIAEGWTLMQIVTPDDQSGTLVGVFYCEKKETGF